MYEYCEAASNVLTDAVYRCPERTNPVDGVTTQRQDLGLPTAAES